MQGVAAVAGGFGSQVWPHLWVSFLGFFATGVAVANDAAWMATAMCAISMLNVGFAYVNSSPNVPDEPHGRTPAR